MTINPKPKPIKKERDKHPLLEKLCKYCGDIFSGNYWKRVCDNCKIKHKKDYQIEYRKDNLESLTEYAVEYYKDNKEKVLRYNKKRESLGLHKTIKKVCRECGNLFMSSRSRRVFCSRVCANESRKFNGTKNCAWCGKEFYVSVSQEKLRNRKCCSRKCGSRYNIQFRKGEKSNLWRGGVSSENRKMRYSAFAEEWRSSVFSRDNYTCMSCGIIGDFLNAHHIKPWAKFPELRFIIDNGATLCKICHKEEHKKMRKNENYVSRFSV